MAKGSFGERLKREREMREVSLSELTKSTRISQRFLEALENEEWSQLPGGIFGRGFVRTIATYLGLDEESLLGEYDLARGDLTRHAPVRPEDRIPGTPGWIPALVVLVMCAILAGLFFAGRYAWHRYTAHRDKQQTSAILGVPQDAPEALAPLPAAASLASSDGTSSLPASAPEAAAPLDLSVSTSAATRVRIVADDKLLLDGELPAGVNRHFSATDHFAVSAADSSAVLLELNHQIMRPLGAPGSSGTIVLGLKDIRQAQRGDTQP
jgi:cytoskeleton protein RodZ